LYGPFEKEAGVAIATLLAKLLYIVLIIAEPALTVTPYAVAFTTQKAHPTLGDDGKLITTLFVLANTQYGDMFPRLYGFVFAVCDACLPSIVPETFRF
jgi:hypothetical protein